uniref:Uncharacterized protein n=1 Tax=Anguilla anguilla TaxID=7936 RepID=A0A0E9SHW0_ANGAN
MSHFLDDIINEVEIKTFIKERKVNFF